MQVRISANPRETEMANALSIGRRWEAYHPTKGVWFWSCAGCVAATIVVGFMWGGWVTGGTAQRMASEAADAGRAQLAAMTCVARFNLGSDATAQLAALNKAQGYERNEILAKGGWVTLPGSTEPVQGAASICAENLMKPPLKTAATR
jgi:hypothetical protein